MSFPTSDALALIQSTLLLLKEEPAILASPEDAAYFRMLQTKTTSNPASSTILPNQNLRSEQLTVAEGLRTSKTNLSEKQETKANGPEENTSENENAAKKPAQLQTDPSSCVETAAIQPSAKLESIVPPSSLRIAESPQAKIESLSPKELIQESTPQAPKAAPSIIQPREAASRPYSQFRSILEKIAPELAILDSIPEDATAKQIANRWKTKNQSAPVSILSSGELPQHKALLSEIATAIDVYFGPARLIEADPIEKEKQWKTFLSAGNLKIIVICDSTLWQLHHLRQYYIETPATGVRMLGDVPIFLLPDLSLYLKDPLLKRSLWKALCSKLS